MRWQSVVDLRTQGIEDARQGCVFRLNNCLLRAQCALLVFDLQSHRVHGSCGSQFFGLCRQQSFLRYWSQPAAAQLEIAQLEPAHRKHKYHHVFLSSFPSPLHHSLPPG
jgi:hypothetical protein